MKEDFRHVVMMTAHEISNATGKNQGVCLAKAWLLYRLVKRLEAGVVRFAYEKADGTLRKANGTLKGASELVKGTGKKNYKTVCYFDADAKDFRSFRVENLVTVY